MADLEAEGAPARLLRALMGVQTPSLGLSAALYFLSGLSIGCRQGGGVKESRGPLSHTLFHKPTQQSGPLGQVLDSGKPHSVSGRGALRSLNIAGRYHVP